MTPYEKALAECRGACCRNALGVCRYERKCAHHVAEKPKDNPRFNFNSPRIPRGMRKAR